MGGQVSIDENVYVVIVGGGFGALRASVQAGFAKQTFMPYKETFGLNFLQGRVIQIDNTEMQTVVLDNGKQVRYSHIILCTGTSGQSPGKHNSVDTYQSAIQKYEDFVKVIQEANTVVVVGGGTTGVEMAAEIRTEFTNKNVILIHPREEVADPDLLHSVKEQAKQVLLEKGVELLLGNDLACQGSACMAENGALKVNKHLQVEGFDSVYAVGACADLDEPKLAYHAGLHAAVAATNIINSLTGKSLTSYRTGNVTMLIAMGKDAGVGQFNGYKLPRFLVTKGKSQSLLLWKSWREMGQKAPN
uniref:Ferroptosis suppressor protein 1 n=1 Tax=Sinocyclocheilus grahami TaxID=75366 RepID=A0A672MU87_SINGR